MNVLKLALYNLRQRLLSGVLTGFLVALGVGLVSGIWILQRQTELGFRQSVGKFHLVVGPKGSGLQLTLNSCFHIDQTVGKLPLPVFQRWAADPRVRAAWPFVTGDTFEGFPLVGTSPGFLNEFEFRPGERFRAAAGGMFDADMQAVLGSHVAESTGLKVGDVFAARHGMIGHTHDEAKYKVVGVLAETRTPHDRVIWCSLESVRLLHDEHADHDHHGHDGHDHDHDHDHAHDHDHDHAPAAKAKEPPAPPDPTDETRFAAGETDDGPVFTSAFFLLKSPQLIGPFQREINDGTDAMAVLPTKQIGDLFDIIGTANQVLEGVSWMVLLAAAVSIFVSLYNSMNERRREIAIVRALGGPARTVFGMIVLEAAILCTAGAVVGYAASHGLLVAAGPLIRENFGVAVRPGAPEIDDLLLLAGMPLVGVLSALIPAVMAYRTDVLANLRPVS
jgi:putative ABC transport system permease protein